MAVTPSGKDKLLRHLRLYVGGYDLSGDSRTFGNAMGTFGEVDFTGWSELVRNYLADGWLQAGLTGYQALMNDTSGRALDQLQLSGNSQASQISLCFGGGGEPAVPDPAYLLPSIQLNDLQAFDGSAAVLSGIDFRPDAAQYTTNFAKAWGIVLQGPTALSATQAASSSISADNGASSSDGFIAHLHILSTSSGDFAFKIRHSADDSAWSDLVTFSADGSAVTAELASGTGTVNRYVAFDATRTAGTVTAICTFVRN